MTKRTGWFYPVRGSYLPCSWQGWLLYTVFGVYIIGPLVARVFDGTDIVYALAQFVTSILLTYIVLTEIAKRKS